MHAGPGRSPAVNPAPAEPEVGAQTTATDRVQADVLGSFR